MFKVKDGATGKVIDSNILSEKEAWGIATQFVIKELGKTPHGRRILGWCDNKLPKETVRVYALVEEMIGDWIPIKNEDDVPEETTEENEIVFLTKSQERFLGYFDSDDGTFVAGDGQVFRSKQIRCYLLLPDEL